VLADNATGDCREGGEGSEKIGGAATGVVSGAVTGAATGAATGANTAAAPAPCTSKLFTGTIKPFSLTVFAGIHGLYAVSYAARNSDKSSGCRSSNFSSNTVDLCGCVLPRSYSEKALEPPPKQLTGLCLTQTQLVTFT
jgi:hypothetical protein